jgi:hypothetical protein
MKISAGPHGHPSLPVPEVMNVAMPLLPPPLSPHDCWGEEEGWNQGARAR